MFYLNSKGNYLLIKIQTIFSIKRCNPPLTLLPDSAFLCRRTHHPQPGYIAQNPLQYPSFAAASMTGENIISFLL